MKMKGTIAILLVIALAAALVGCSPKGETQNLTDAPLTGETVADFASGAPAAMFPSDGWSNGNPFNVFWKGDCVSFSDGEMHLGIEKPASGGDNWEYYGGEERSSLWYGYGDFEVRMKPAKVEGTASTFFTCTGPYDTGLDGTPNQHDEIDIEFLGKNTKGVQFNYFVNGQGGHEYWYDLGFDASEEYHDYGFRWEENSITWFVDGKPVYKVNRQSGEPFPSHPGRILANYWCGTIEAVAWMGAYKDSAATADYKWIKSSAQSYDLNPAPDEQENGADEITASAVDWSAVEPIELAFTSTNGKHEIESAGTVTKVTYSGIDNDWSNITAALEGKANGGNVMSLRLRNDDTSDDHRVRIDLMKDGKCVNTSATMNGAGVFTDLEWGGSFFENIPAGGEAEIEIAGSAEPDAIVIMLDSMRQGDEKQYSGAFTISDVKFASSGAEAAPSEPAQTDEPADESGVTINGAAVKVTTDGSYALDVTDAGFTAEYENIAGNSYQTVYVNTYEAMAGSNVFTAKLTNSGAEPANIRVDISCDVQSGNSTAANLAAAQNGAEVYTDLEWGGSTFTVQPGETADIAIEYDVERAPKGVLFFFDSAKYDDNGTHSGSVTVSEMAFSSGEVTLEAAPAAVTTAAVIRDSSTAVPSAPKVKSIEINGRSSALNITDGYSVKTFDGGFSAEYKDLPGNSYKTVYCALGDMAGAYNTAVCEIENPGELEVKVRVDLTSTKAVANTNAANVRAVQDGAEAPTDLEWGGSVFVIAPQSKASVAVEYDPAREVDGLLFYFDSATYDDTTAHSGAVRVTGIKLTNDGAEPTAKEEEESEKTEEKTPGVLVNDTVVAFEGQYDVAYAEDGASMTVSYENVGGASYKTLYGQIADILGESEAFTAKIENLGTAPATVRIDINSATEKNNTKAANVRAEQDGKSAPTDLDWGGSVFVIQPGRTSEIYVEFDASRTVEGVLIYFDSATYGDTGVYSSTLTLSGLSLCEKREAPKPAAVSYIPYTPPAPSSVKINGRSVSFNAWGSPTYTLSYPDGTLEAAYKNIMGSTYIGFNGDITAVKVRSNGYNKFTFTVKNEGAESALIGVDIRTENEKVAEAEGQEVHSTILDAEIVSGEAEGLNVNKDWKNVSFSVPAGKSATAALLFEPGWNIDKLSFSVDSGWEENPAAHTGMVVLSDMEFTKYQPFAGNDDVEITYDVLTQKSTAVFSEEGGELTIPEKPKTGENKVSVELTNPTDEDVTVKVEVEAEGQLMAENNDNTFTVPAHRTITAEVSFNSGEAVSGVKISSSSAATIEIGKISFSTASEEPKPQPEPSATALKVGEKQISFDGNNDYTVTYNADGTEATFEYAGIAGNSYKNAYGWYGAFGEADTLSFKVKNNGESAAKILTQISVENTTIAEKVADVAANGEETVAIKFTTEGEGGIVLFIDTCWSDSSERSGSVTISGLTLSKTETTPEPQPQPEPSAYAAIKVNETELTFEPQDTYTVTYGENGATAAYEDIPGASYKNLELKIDGITGEFNTFSGTLTNNGTAAVKVRIDVESETQINNTKAANTKATVNGEEVTTDTDWGGSSFEIAAGETASFAVEYDSSRTVKSVKLFFDTFTYGDEGTHTGSVTISGLTLSKTETDTAAQLAFTTDSGSPYTVTNSGKSNTFSYENKTINYENVSADISAAASGMDTVTFKLTAPEGHKLRVDIINSADWSAKLNSSMTYGGTAVEDGSNIWYTNEGEKTVSVKYSGTAEFIVIYMDSGESAKTASFTLSDFTFTKEDE
ncbi:MAG: glycoside hydrolase family 16 protein [Oscillospiraceae bacterium]|nr:glycoside hydrolase family 16 protein [Oscillospiraceae bacterium]